MGSPIELSLMEVKTTGLAGSVGQTMLPPESISMAGGVLPLSPPEVLMMAPPENVVVPEKENYPSMRYVCPLEKV